jgi:hypothetical protein
LKLRIHLFEWPSRHNVHLALPLMLVLSFLLHAACLFIFQATLPRSESSREHSAVAYALLPNSPEAAKIGPMLAASDPALFSTTKIIGQKAWKLPETAYVASFDEEVPALAPLPAPPFSQFLPPDLGTAPVGLSGSATRVPPPPEPPVPTAVRFGGDLEGRSWNPPQSFIFSSTAALERHGLAPAEFLLAVSADGLPLYSFLQRSSGNEDLDRAASRYLAAGRFAASSADREPIWGTATFVWGADVRQEGQQ